MAKKKEIKYNLLNKTANESGTIFDTHEGIHYVGNVYCVVYGMNDEEFNLAIDKSKANEYNGLGEKVFNVVKNLKSANTTAEYTNICYDSYEGMLHYFRTSKGNIVRLNGKFFEIVKDLDIINVYGLNMQDAIVFELKDGKGVMIFPMLKSDGKNEMIEKIIEKIYC